MNIKRGSLEEFHSCNNCKRGRLTENGRGLEYPYTHVTRIELAAMSFSLCDECITELKRGIESTESTGEVEDEQ